MHHTLDKRTMGWLISGLVPVTLLLLPVNEIFTQPLKQFFIITTFVIMIIAFELLPQIISACLLPCLYWMTGLVPIQTAFRSWATPTVWIVLGGLIFSTALDRCGLLRRISYAIILKCGGTYRGAVYGCFLSGILLNVITFCNGWLVASALVFGVCQAMHLKPSRESALLCFAGIAGASGPTVFLYYPGYYTIIEESIRIFLPEYTMGLFDTLLYNGFGLVLFFLAIWVMLRVYHAEEIEKNFDKTLFYQKYQQLGPMSLKEKKCAWIVVLLLAYLFSTTFTGMPAVYGFVLAPVLMYLPGIDAASRSTIASVNVSIVFFVSACLGIGIVGAQVGFGDFLAAVVPPLLEGRSKLFACIVFMLFGTAANFFMTPYAMLGGLSIPFAQIAVSLGMNPIGVVMVLLWSCEILFLPYQSAGYLIMYGYGLMSMKQFIQQVGLKSLLMLAGFTLIMFPVWNLLGMI